MRQHRLAMMQLQQEFTTGEMGVSVRLHSNKQPVAASSSYEFGLAVGFGLTFVLLPSNVTRCR
jgi:hypothetical protein